MKTYHVTKYGLISRRKGTKEWYGKTNYKSEEEARNALSAAIVIDAKTSDIYDYRIVKYECECEILHEETRRL